ncbi:MAG: glycosyltransferase family 4 protein [Bacteroidia bacterium]|nr:glycosyltransferase family 4 protein [Bacteroidia bacterium]
MKKVLFIAPHRPNRCPSQRFRFEQYLDYLLRNGYSYDFHYLLSKEDDHNFYSSSNYFKKSLIVMKSLLKRIKDVLNSSSYDIIFVQREAIMLGMSIFEFLFSNSRAKLIYDLDDSIWISDVSHANQNLSWLKKSSKTNSILKYSDMVFAGNKFLADYSSKYNNNVKIVPTTIDTNLYIKMNSYKANSKVCIGWSGSITTIRHFEWAVPILMKIKNKYMDNVYFKVIGDASYANYQLDVVGIPWQMENEINELSEIDIGIMPLPDDDWSKGKCGLKGLQYMALEIPTLMSPVGVNTEIINDGVNGFLPESELDWIEKISLLVENQQLRKVLGKNGRKTVIEKYSVNVWGEMYLHYFNELICS